MKYAFVTFGCRVNQADSLALEGDFLARGAVPAPPGEADVVVVNTCSVTAAADQGARQTIRRIVRSNPSVKVIVTGCYATRSPEEVGQLPNVMRVVCNPAKDALVDLIAGEVGLPTPERFGDGDGPCGATLDRYAASDMDSELLAGEPHSGPRRAKRAEETPSNQSRALHPTAQACAVGAPVLPGYQGQSPWLVPGVAGRTAFTLRVQTGCDEQCSYCIIPKTRGAGRSKPMPLVIRDIERAAASGYKEIVLTGVHLGSFGRDLDDQSSLTALVRRLADWPDDVLFRISSLEPMDCTAEIVEAAAQSPRIAPHFHLPLQHGADDMLRAMRRPYTAAAYQRLIDRIRTRIPDASIGSDIIVGFPGETDAHFDDMRRLLENLPLTHVHVFPYSDRPGTESSRLVDKVDGAVTRARGGEVRAIGEGMVKRFRESQEGMTRRALTVDDGWSAVTDNYLKVRLEQQYPRNQWVDVTI